MKVAVTFTITHHDLVHAVQAIDLDNKTFMEVPYKMTKVNVLKMVREIFKNHGMDAKEKFINEPGVIAFEEASEIVAKLFPSV